jgi:hypothetical protein
MSEIMTLITRDGVYRVRGAARACTVTTELRALEYAARHLSHRQWSQILREERIAAGQPVIALPDESRTR